MSQHKPRLSIDFLYGRDYFPQEEMIKAVQALPPPDEVRAYLNGVLREEYLGVTRAVIRLLVATSNEDKNSAMNQHLRILRALARHNFKAIDSILAKIDIEDILDKNDFYQEGYAKSFSFVTERPDQKKLVEFFSNESVFRSFRKYGSTVLTFRKDDQAQFTTMPSGIEVCFNPCYKPPSYGGQAFDLYRDSPSVMRKIKNRKMHRWQSFLSITDKDYIEESANPQLFEYAAQ